MSLIGPRPERPEIDQLLEKNIDLYNFKYTIKPGISGWAQVNYPYGASIEDAKYKLSYDLFYILFSMCFGWYQCEKGPMSQPTLVAKKIDFLGISSHTLPIILSE